MLGEVFGSWQERHCLEEKVHIQAWLTIQYGEKEHANVETKKNEF